MISCNDKRPRATNAPHASVITTISLDPPQPRFYFLRSAWLAPKPNQPDAATSRQQPEPGPNALSDCAFIQPLISLCTNATPDLTRTPCCNALIRKVFVPSWWKPRSPSSINECIMTNRPQSSKKPRARGRNGQGTYRDPARRPFHVGYSRRSARSA